MLATPKSYQKRLSNTQELDLHVYFISTTPVCSSSYDVKLLPADQSGVPMGCHEQHRESSYKQSG